MPFNLPSTSCGEAARRRSFLPRFTVPAVCSILAGLSLAPSQVSAQGALGDGDGIVTMFSGLDRAPDGTPRPDRNGAVLRGLGLAAPGFPANGSLWEDQQLLFSLTARDIGQVFAVAFDGEQPANAYVAATSAFGLYRTQNGDDWAPGMWGPDGGPGTIWKLNGERGYRPEKFANVTYVDTPNQGSGIGDLAFDPWHNQLFVSDLESGLIHRYDLDGALLESFDHGVDGRSFFVDAETGEDARLDAVQHDPDSAPNFDDCPSAFDSTPECWNYADFRRRVWGLGVFDDPESGTVRLYYAVWGGAALGSEDWEAGSEDAVTTVWSVAVAEGGWFDPTDVRREVALPLLTEGSDGSVPVTDIAFTRNGTMILAERGRPDPDFESDEFPTLVRPDEARVLRLVQGGGGRWRVDGRYDAGFPSGGEAGVRANSGGALSLGHGFEEDGTPEPDRPDGTIWMSVTTLCSQDDRCVGRDTGERDESGPAAGLQGIPADLQEDLDLQDGEPSGPLASYLVRLRGAGQVVGDVGGIAIYRSELPTQIVSRPAREEPVEQVRPEAAEEPGAEEVVEETEALQPARLTSESRALHGRRQRMCPGNRLRRGTVGLQRGRRGLSGAGRRRREGRGTGGVGVGRESRRLGVRGVGRTGRLLSGQRRDRGGRSRNACARGPAGQRASPADPPELRRPDLARAIRPGAHSRRAGGARPARIQCWHTRRHPGSTDECGDRAGSGVPGCPTDGRDQRRADRGDVRRGGVSGGRRRRGQRRRLRGRQRRRAARAGSQCRGVSAGRQAQWPGAGTA